MTLQEYRRERSREMLRARLQEERRAQIKATVRELRERRCQQD